MEKLADIINGIKRNEFVLPDFQREFVWNFKQQRDLISSVISAVPASSSLLVEERNFRNPNFRFIKVGQRNSENQFIHETPFHYILDGQQRFTTLYYAFTNTFDSTTEANEKTFKHLDYKLRVRWFLNFRSKSGFLFNFNTLIYDETSFDKYLPNDITDFIEEERIKIDTVRKDANDYLKLLKEKSLEDCKIPIQLFLSNGDQSYKIKTWLKEIQGKRISELRNNPKNKDSLIDFFKHFNVEEPSKVADDLYDDSEYAIEIYNSCINDEAVCDWYDRVYNYLRSKIADYEIKPIVLNDMFKAVSTFEYINTRGTDLSTFDLLCAKSGLEFDLRKSVVEECVKPFRFYDDDFNVEKDFSLELNFSLIDQNHSVQKQYAEYLSQVFNLLHFKKNNGLPNENNFGTNLQKSNYSLDNLNGTFLKNNYKEAVKIINLTCAILQVFCAHKDYRKIQNKLALLPIFTFLVYREEEEITPKQTKQIIAFFWIKLFSGEYDAHQSEKAKIHCKEMYEWLITGNKDIKRELKHQLNNDVLKVKDYANKEMLTTQRCNKSVEENIFMFLRSLNRTFYDWDDKSSVINIKDDVQNHHIIPLFQGITKMKGLTKALRDNPDNKLNATMNRTPISKKTNLDIGAKSPHQYKDEVKATQLDHHFITENWFKANPNLSNLFDNRYDALVTAIRTKLDNYLS